MEDGKTTVGTHEQLIASVPSYGNFIKVIREATVIKNKIGVFFAVRTAALTLFFSPASVRSQRST